MRRDLPAVLAFIALALAACAAMPDREPVQVTVVDIDSIPGEDLELRLNVKLRVQNPNSTPIDYEGVYVQLDVQDKTFATGVSDQRGTIGAFGESVIEVPVSASILRSVFNVLGMMGNQPPERINYRLRGKLSGPMFGSTSFESRGDLALPAAARQ